MVEPVAAGRITREPPMSSDGRPYGRRHAL